MLRDHNDQIALKHSLDYGRSSEIYHYRYIVIIRPHNYGKKKYALISPRNYYPRVCIYEKRANYGRMQTEMKYKVF